jgi:hypothetical protein
VVKVEKQTKKLMEAVDKAEEEKKQKMEASSGVDDAISSLREQVADAKRECCLPACLPALLDGLERLVDVDCLKPPPPPPIVQQAR